MMYQLKQRYSISQIGICTDGIHEEKIMKKKPGLIISVILAICIIVFCFIYTRARTVEQRYPYLDLAQCTKIEGNFYKGMITELTPYTIYPGEARFEELIEVIRSAEFKTKLSNLLPKGTKIHRATEDGINWDIEYYFDNVMLPDGSVSSGGILGIQYFYGDLTLTVNGEIINCSVVNEKEWALKIMDIIQQAN